MNLPLAEARIGNSFPPTLERKNVSFKVRPHTQVYLSNSTRISNVTEVRLSEPRDLINHFRDDIEGHVERRIQLFFQELILSHNTPFQFTFRGAEDQYGVGTTKNRRYFTTQAAHSSTFPCLYAQPLAGGDSFVFLKHSHAYNLHNSTVELPTFVNQTDTLLDKKFGEDGLRGRTITIINQNARGDLGPREGLRRFLVSFERRLYELIEELPETDPRFLTACAYLEKVHEYQFELDEGDELFDQIMGVQVGDDDPLRDIVFRERYKVIQDSQFIESRLARRILETQNAMFNTRLRSLRHINTNLRYALLRNCGADLQQRLERVLCTSLAQLESSFARQASLRNFQTSTERKIDNTELQNLLRDLRALFREQTRREFNYRSQLFYRLRREYKNWTQRTFANRFKGLFPTQSMSPSMVSRLEQPSRLPTNRNYATPLSQRRKFLTQEKVAQIARTYEVDKGLFLPLLV